MASSSWSMWFDHTPTHQEANEVQPTSFLPETLNHEYIMVSPEILLDDGRYICEVCHKGFPTKQNFSLHQKTHNIKPTLKTRTPNLPMPKRVFLCPEPTCIHHNRSHTLVDFGNLRKHYLRKHSAQKNYICSKCSKEFSVESDLKAHSKKCHGKQYTCHQCNDRFSRSIELIVHQKYCNGIQHLGAGSDPQTLTMQTLNMQGMEENTIMLAGGDQKIPMTNHSFGSNSSEIPPRFFHPASIEEKQQEYHYDIRFYENLMKDEHPLYPSNIENTNLIGNGMYVFGVDNGSYPSLNGFSMFDASNSLNVNPAMPNPSLTGVPNATTASSNWGGYEQGAYGYGSAQIDFTSSSNAFNFGNAASTTASFPPFEHNM